MSPTLALGFALTICGVGPAAPVLEASIGPERQARSFEDLYRSGVTFAEFLENAEARVEGWHRNYGEGSVPARLTMKARAIPGSWRLLVVAEDWCGDSVNTIPYIARLVEGVNGLDMRIIDSEVGKGVMDAHPTPDGRGATPTVLLLDEDGRRVGCWTERPSELQKWWIENPDHLSSRRKLRQKYAWYDRDKGESTLEEIVGLIEAAAGGSPHCPGS